MRKYIFALLFLLLPSNVIADATTLPLIQSGDIKYLGYFTLDPDDFNGEPRGLAFYSSGGTDYLYIGMGADSNTDTIGRVIIPSYGSKAKTDISPTRFPGVPANANSGYVEPAGMLVYNGRLILTKRVFWEDSVYTVDSHAYVDLSLTSFSSLLDLDVSHRRYVNGYMGLIPSEWQTLLGGPAFTGNSMESRIQTASVGPTFFVFDPDDLGVEDSVTATPLMLYPYDGPTWETSILDIDPQNASVWISEADQENAGIVFPSGTRSILFFYRHGNTYCYGTGVECSDSCIPDHGEHSYPYHRQIMAFDANDLLAVKNGTKEYYDVEPYGHWYAPNAEGDCDHYEYGSLAYDDTHGIIYVATKDLWDGQGANIIQVYGLWSDVSQTDLKNNSSGSGCFIGR